MLTATSCLFFKGWMYICQMCLALAKMVPLAGLQDDTCPKTIHSIRQMCLAMAKYTTGRAPRRHMYQDHTQYASDVCGYGTKMIPLAGRQDHRCTKTLHNIHQMCLAIPLVGRQDHSRPEKENEKSYFSYSALELR